MIVRSRPSALGLLVTMRGSIVPRIAPKILAVACLAALVVAARLVWPARLPELGAMPFTLLGLALSIFLGFRNNACYERWWEGRRQWGALLAESRAVARAIVAVLPAGDADLRTRLGWRVIAFAAALRDQLRGDAMAGWVEMLPADEVAAVLAARSRPDAILLGLEAELAALMRAGVVSDILYRGFADRLVAMGSVQAACERLAGTPTPFAYSLLLHRTAWLFCLLLPLGIAGSVGWMTPVVVVVLAYAFFGLDALGDELEEPFTRTENALPLDAMVRGIEIAVRAALGEGALPPAAVPEGMVLL